MRPPSSEKPRAARQLDSTQRDALRERRKRLLAALDHAFAPARIVGALAEAGLTAGDLAIASGAHERTASAWLDDSRPGPKIKHHQERLRELKLVTRFMVDNGTIAYQEADWLRDPHRGADLKTPLELIHGGEWKLAGRLYCDDVAVEPPAMFLPDTPDHDPGGSTPNRVVAR
jgi:hypothetical protein